MALPAAAARGVEKAAALIAAARPVPGNGNPPTTTPAPAQPAQPAAAPGAEDVATLKAALEKAQRDLARLNNTSTAHGRARLEAEERATKAETKVKELEEQIKRKVESGDVTGISDEERRLLGDDAVRATVKIAREVAAGEFDQRVRPLTERFDQFEKMTEAQYWATLDDLVPDWETINNKVEFKAWLGEVDMASGRTRLDLIRMASGAWHGYRVAEIFRAYKEGREIGARQDPTRAALETRTEPPPGGGNPPPADVEAGRIWKRSDIKQFYRDKREGKWKGKEKEIEARTLEMDINAAYREGRIRDG
jgi:hypothetical protein